MEMENSHTYVRPSMFHKVLRLHTHTGTLHTYIQHLLNQSINHSIQFIPPKQNTTTKKQTKHHNKQHKQTNNHDDIS